MIVGVSPGDPTCELTRTEYVRVGTQHALLKRIVEAAAIDTVIDTRHGRRLRRPPRRAPRTRTT